MFEKISKLHAKNGFSLAIVLGDLFADPAVEAGDSEHRLTSLISGDPPIPLPTYFSLGKCPLPKQVIDKIDARDGEVCDNLIYLGKRATIKTTEGLRIVCLGGLLDTNLAAGLSKDKYLPYHTDSDARSLHGANKADILLTHAWPASVRSKSLAQWPENVSEPAGEQCVSDLCSFLKPRYHFSPSENAFFEREPFWHPSTDDIIDRGTITRFISLAAYENKFKQKWLYAFSIDLAESSSGSLPLGATASPFIILKKKRPHLPDQEQAYSRFAGTSDTTRHRDRHAKRSRNKGPPPGPQECFFCLSNPNLAAHLITSIGNDSYLTTAKGPLSTAKTYDSITFPAHILIIPLSHSPNLATIMPPESRASTFNEMTHYRHGLQRMLSSQAKGSLGAVTWELSRAGGIHVHWQFLPVNVDLIRRGLVEAGFQVEAENDKYPLLVSRDIEAGSDERGDYFRVWIWAPEEAREADVHASNLTGREQQLVLPLPSEGHFDLQFGRRVMAKLLGLETRMQWRDCLQPEDEERREAESFKDAFKEFDFSLDESS